MRFSSTWRGAFWLLLVGLAWTFPTTSASAEECTGTKVFCVNKCLYPRECEEYKEARKRRSYGKLNKRCKKGNVCNRGLVCKKKVCRKRRRPGTASSSGKPRTGKVTLVCSDSNLWGAKQPSKYIQPWTRERHVAPGRYHFFCGPKGRIGPGVVVTAKAGRSYMVQLKPGVHASVRRTITCAPSADIFINGVKKGTGSVTINARPGSKVKLYCSRSGHKSVGKVITIGSKTPAPPLSYRLELVKTTTTPTPSTTYKSYRRRSQARGEFATVLGYGLEYAGVQLGMSFQTRNSVISPGFDIQLGYPFLGGHFVLGFHGKSSKKLTTTFELAGLIGYNFDPREEELPEIQFGGEVGILFRMWGSSSGAAQRFRVGWTNHGIVAWHNYVVWF